LVPGATADAIFQDHLRCYKSVATRRDLGRLSRGRDDRPCRRWADSNPRVKRRSFAFWGQQGTVGALYDVLETRREKALDRGHSLQEEKPDQFF
jgi:haloacetate dehalogenase